MEITINNYKELLDFIERDDITLEQADEVVSKFLNVLCFGAMTKSQLIDSTKYFINKFCKDNVSERPIFLNQLGDEFNIKDIYKND